MLTRLEIVEKVRAGLLAQGRKATESDFGSSPGGRCVYRSSDGRRCAIGQLIDPSIQTEEFEGATISLLQATATGLDRWEPDLEKNPRAWALGLALQASGVPLDAKTLKTLRSLQRLHDDAPEGQEVEYWTRRLGEILTLITAEILKGDSQ